MMVYDSRGQKIGKVKDIHKYKKTNTLLSIVVEKGFLGGKDTITFTKKQIKEIGRNIVLNISVKK
jgi:sporulation protein YlmC with PRC-barrel domain